MGVYLNKKIDKKTFLEAENLVLRVLLEEATFDPIFLLVEKGGKRVKRFWLPHTSHQSHPHLRQIDPAVGTSVLV